MENKKKYYLKDALILGGQDKDIADEVFDWCNCYCYNLEIKDDFDAVLDWIASSLEVVSVGGSFVVCKVSQFIDQNRSIFDTFLNLIYKTEYQPQNMEKITADSEEFYDYYLRAFADIINGNISDEEYALLKCLIFDPKKAPVGYIVEDTIYNTETGEKLVYFTGADGYVYDMPESPRPYKAKRYAERYIEKSCADSWHFIKRTGENTYTESDIWEHTLRVLVVELKNE